MEDISSMRRSAIKPIAPNINKDRLCYCDDCYKGIYKHGCNQLFVCEKCNTKVCKDCYDYSAKCVACNQRLTIFLKRDDIRIPENISHFVPVKKKKPWYCLLLC